MFGFIHILISFDSEEIQFYLWLSKALAYFSLFRVVVGVGKKGFSAVGFGFGKVWDSVASEDLYEEKESILHNLKL